MSDGSEIERSEVIEVGARLAVGVIEAYRQFVSPLLGRHCRFEPSCSAYAVEAIADFGLVRGSFMAAGRLLRCHPFHPGGFDPVPNRGKAA